MQLNYSLSSNKAICPRKSRETSAGYDLFATERVIILSTEIKLINTHFRAELPRNSYAQILGKSKLATRGLVILGGVVDEDYRGDWVIVCYNAGNNYICFEPGDAVAQFIILSYKDCVLHQVELLSDTARGASGVLDHERRK